MNTDNQGVYNARELGKPKFVLLGIQHLFAMFGATILVPPVSYTHLRAHETHE